MKTKVTICVTIIKTSLEPKNHNQAPAKIDITDYSDTNSSGDHHKLSSMLQDHVPYDKAY